MLVEGTLMWAACLSGTRKELLLVGWFVGGVVNGSKTDAIVGSTALSLWSPLNGTIGCELLLTGTSGSVLTSTFSGWLTWPLEVTSWVIFAILESPSLKNYWTN